MTPLAHFDAVAILALGLGAIVVAALHRPLFAVVADLCGTRERAVFWSIYLSTLLALVPLLFVAFLAGYSNGPLATDLLIERAVFYAPIGLIGALLAIGWGVWRPSDRLHQRQLQAGATAARDERSV
jgi:hypothetical protein